MGFEGLRGSCGGVCGVGGVAKGIIVESRLGNFFTNSHILPKWVKIEICKYFYWNPHCLVHQKPFFKLFFTITNIFNGFLKLGGLKKT